MDFYFADAMLVLLFIGAIIAVTQIVAHLSELSRRLKDTQDQLNLLTSRQYEMLLAAGIRRKPLTPEEEMAMGYITNGSGMRRPYP